MAGSQSQFPSVVAHEQLPHDSQLEQSLMVLQSQVPPAAAEQGTTEQTHSGKKNKSSKKEKRKKDKKKKDKDRDRERESLLEPPPLLLPDGMPNLHPHLDMSGHSAVMPTLETEKVPKPEKEKKKKKNKKKDKDRGSAPSLTAQVDTSGSTGEEHTLGSLFSNMDQSISAPQFFDIQDNTNSHTVEESLNTLLTGESAMDTSIDTSMEVDDSGKKSKSKSKSKRSRSKKRLKDNPTEIVSDLLMLSSGEKEPIAMVPDTARSEHMDIRRSVVDMQTVPATDVAHSIPITAKICTALTMDPVVPSIPSLKPALDSSTMSETNKGKHMAIIDKCFNFMAINDKCFNFMAINYKCFNFMVINYKCVNFMAINDKFFNFMAVNYKCFNFMVVNYKCVDFMAINDTFFNFMAINYKCFNFMAINYKCFNFMAINYKCFNFMA